MSYIFRYICILLVLITLAIPAASNEDKIAENHNIIVEIGEIEKIDNEIGEMISGHFRKQHAAKRKLLEKRIEKGLNYLYDNQLPNGKFAVYLSFSPDMSDRRNETELFGNVQITFDTGLILHTLNLADNKHTKEIVKEMKTKAISFLLDNMEKHGVWRFWGKNHSAPPDVDDTSVIYAALVESGVDISDDSLDYMLNFTTADGIFYVWINSEEFFNPSNPYYNEPKFRLNQIDHNVNANALYAYSLRNRTPVKVIIYLKGIIENGIYQDGSLYYPSPYVFAYFVTKAYSEGNVDKLKPYVNNIKEYLLRTQNPDGGWGNDLYTALATNALINIGYKGKPLEKAIEHILYAQNKDGSWDIYSFYRFSSATPTINFGSEELTTSFSLEALIKHKRNLLKMK